MMEEMERDGFRTEHHERGRHDKSARHGEPVGLFPPLVLFWIAWLISPSLGSAQVGYVARFAMEKETFLLGEPIFCRFTIQNTGPKTFGFSYRTPSRVLNPELEVEPRFTIRDEDGRRLPDPAPRPCGGAKGSVLYGSATLPAGQTHTERWLLDQWARFTEPGRYHLRAERRLPLLALNPATQEFSHPPVAYALAINELSFEIKPSSPRQVRAAFQPYLKALDDPAAKDLAEPVLVLTTLPRPFFLKRLLALATAPADERRWDRHQALEGLARLGTRAAWVAISKIARGEHPLGPPSATADISPPDSALRSYAILLLGQKADTAYLPALLDIAGTAPGELRGDVLRTLGLFNDTRANQVLFDNLRSPVTTDRVNAILGLRNLESKDAIPALLAMLNDPDAQVRQVAHFALQGLTGQKFKLPADASRAEFARTAEQWRAWWRENSATFVPRRTPPCQDW